MTAVAGTLKLVVDSTSVGSAEKALDSLAATGATVEGKITVDMGNIEQAMARLAQQMGYLDKTMVDGFAKMVQASQKANAANTNTVRSFDEIRRAIDPLYAAQQKYASTMLDVNAAVARGEASQAQANAVLEIAASRYLGVETAAEKMATQVARVEQAEREAAAATQLATQNYETLRASLDPLYASSKRYEQAQETLAAAVKAGAVSQEQANRVLRMAETQYLGMNGALGKGKSAVGAAGMAFRNAGYQIQDFAVQVASGQSAMMAFSQQAPQLMEGLGLAGRIGRWVTVAATVLAVGTAIYQVLYKASDPAKVLSDRMDDLTDAVSSYKTATDNALMSTDDITKKFGAYSAQARETYNVLRDLAQLDAMKKLSDATAAMTASADEGAKRIAVLVNAANNAGVASAGAASALSKEFSMTTDQAQGLLDHINAIGSAKGPEEQAKATAALNDYFKEVYGTTTAIPEKLQALAKEAANGNIAAMTLLATMKETSVATSDAAGQASILATNLAAAAGALTNLRNATMSLDLDTIGLEAQNAALKAGNDLIGARTAALIAQERYRLSDALGSSDAVIRKEAIVSLNEYTASIQRKAAAERENQTLTTKSTKAVKASGSAAKSASTDQEKLTDQLQQQADAYTDAVNPLAKYQRDMSNLQQVQHLMTTDDYAAYAKKLNLELADSLPLVSDLSDAWGQFVASGFKSFDDFGDAFKNLLAQMASDAMKQQIVMSLGLTTSATGTSSSLTGSSSSSSGSSILSTASNAMNAIKLATSNFMTGAWATISATWSSGLAGLTGSVSSAFSAMTSAASGFAAGTVSASTTLASLGTALGAVAAPLAAVAAAVSFFSTKTKLLDSGLRVTISDNEALVETYKKIKKTKFWGLSSKTSTGYSTASAEVSDPITEAIYSAQASILSMASTLGVASSAFDDFSYTLKVSTKGLTDDEISEALEDALNDANDAYSLMIDGLDDLIETGETATDALTRLSTAITTVNGALDTLNYSFQYAGITGAAAADSLADLFGSTDDLTSSVSSYWDTFYSEAEQQAILTRQATTALAAYNVQLPTTRDAYRALIDAQDLSTESGRALWAVLVQMSSVMDEILPTISSITDEIEGLLGTTSNALSDAIDSLTDLAKLNAQAADDWYNVADNVADLIADIRGTAGDVTTDLQALAYNQSRYLAAYQAAMSGDLDAAENVSTYAKSYLSSVTASSGSRAEAAIAQAKVVAQLSALDTLSTKQGATFDTIAALQTQTVDVLKLLSDLIDSGNIDTASILNATVSGNGLTSSQLAEIQTNNGLSSAQVAALASLNSLTATGTGLSTAQLSALGSLTTLGASELQAFATAIGALNTQTTTLSGSLVGIDHSSATMLAAMNAASIDVKSVISAIASLRSAILDQGKITAVNDLLAGLDTNSNGQTYLTASNLAQLASIYGIDVTGKSAEQTAAAVADYSSSDSISAGSYVLDLGGEKQAAKAALESQLDTAIASLTSIVSAVNTFDADTSGDFTNASGGVTSPYVTSAGRVAWTNGSPTGISNYNSSGLAAWKKTWWADGGLEDRMWAADSAVASLNNQIAAYASGGSHAGGLRLVGEEGPELEVTGPSRIYSAGQTQRMLGAANDELIAEVRALKQQMAETTTWAKKTADSATTTAKGVRRATEMGWGTGA